MCGVNVIVDKTNSLSDEVIIRMNDALKHRGPDDHGYKTFKLHNCTVYIGNTRLKIRGLTPSSAQPTENSVGCLSFNGEIYSHKKKPVHEDTPYLLEFLRNNNIRKIGELNGMYAFAYLDFEAQELWIARDPQGIKPLYKYEDEQFIVISSEIAGVLASQLVHPELNKETVLDYLQFKHAVRPNTFFTGIAEVEPGFVVDLFSKNSGKISTPGDLSVSSLETIWLNTLGRQVDSQKDVGVFISGGVDSSLILAGLKKIGFEKPRTFSITNSSFELAQINKVTSTFPCEHTNYSYNPDRTDWEGFIDSIDQPIGDSGAFLTYLLSKEARKSVGVILSGAGGDELFAGYNRHLAFSRYLKYKSFLVSSIARSAGQVISSVYHGEKGRLISKLITSVDEDPSVTYSNFVSLRPGKKVVANDLSEALEYDRLQYLVSDVLALSDKMSMVHGLEIRVPFLDNEMLRFVQSKDASELIAKGPKWMLQDLLRKMGGAALIKYPKRGFGINYREFAKLPIRRQLLDRNILENLHGFVSDEDLGLLCSDPEKLDSQVMWNHIILAHWMDRKLNR